ncbi:MAG: DUF4296 domain-containing protein [Cytophagales bacterium]|nr:DUF4296 domain-containing protein [Cytophagales bacterium]
MRTLGYFSLLCFCWISCQSPDPSRASLSVPFSPEDMVAVLVDIHLSEAMLKKASLSPTALIQKRKIHIEHIWKKHGMTRISYNQAFRHYALRPKEMFEIYEDVKERLSQWTLNSQTEYLLITHQDALYGHPHGKRSSFRL